MNIRAVYFDFGFVIGYPRPGIDRKFFYLDWHGIETLYHDPEMAMYFRPGVTPKDVETFFVRELYEPFVHHEQTDLRDPQSNTRLHATLHQLFTCAVTQSFVEKLLRHVDTMKYIRVDSAAIEVIQALQSRYMLSLISNMMLPGTLLLTKLRQANLIDAFHTISISSDVGFLKPHPNIFLHTLHGDGLQPEQVVFVGDTYAQDIRGAQQVGMHTIWLNSRHESREGALENPPDAEIQHIQELLYHPLLTAE